MTWLREQLSQLIIHFSVKQRLVSNGQVRDLDRFSLSSKYLIGRDICQYACIDLGNVQKAKRHQALSHQIRLLSPWSDFAFTVAWKDGVAQVWFWSVSQVNQVLVSQSQDQDSRAALYPPEFFSEAMFWRKAVEDGIHLYKANYGVDVQYWRQGLLLASQWFPNVPGASQLQRFARALGAGGNANIFETLQEPIFIEKAWDGVGFSFLDHLFDRRSQILVYAAAVSLLIASLQLNSVFQLYNQISTLQEQTDGLARSAEPLLTARSAARAAKQDAEEIAGLFVLPNPLMIQELVQQAFPVHLKVDLQTWERNIDQIDMGVKGDISDTLSVVRAFERAGFDSVRVEPLPESKQYRIRLRFNANSANRLNEK